MEARGLSGGELARRAGFTAQYVNSLRSKDRGARLPFDTARRLALALGVSTDWLLSGSGARERQSDVYPAYVEGPPDHAPPTDRWPSRGEVIALLASSVEPEVIAALRAAVPPDLNVDPGRAYWIGIARELARDLQRIRADPVLGKRGDGLPAATPRRKAKG